jgi:uncharacterized protein YycO
MKSFGLFMRTSDIWSPVIRMTTWSPWSHVATILSKDLAYESLFKTGVIRNTVAKILERATKFEFVEYDTDNPKLMKFMEGQLGKPYDYTAVLGIAFHRDWQEDDSWFCSELHAAGHQYAGNTLIDKKCNRVTPYDAYASIVGKKLGAGIIPPELNH